MSTCVYFYHTEIIVRDRGATKRYINLCKHDYRLGKGEPLVLAHTLQLIGRVVGYHRISALYLD